MSARMPGSTLVAGIGNIFWGDDGFGVEVLKRLGGLSLPENVVAIDFGIRGVDLAYELLDPRYEHVVLVDAVQRGGAPGTVYLIQPRVENADGEGASNLMAQTHNLDPAKVLSWVGNMGMKFKTLHLVGCEPSFIGTEDDMRMELSEPVLAAVDEAVKIVLKLTGEPCMN